MIKWQQKYGTFGFSLTANKRCSLPLGNHKTLHLQISLIYFQSTSQVQLLRQVQKHCRSCENGWKLCFQKLHGRGFKFAFLQPRESSICCNYIIHENLVARSVLELLNVLSFSVFVQSCRNSTLRNWRPESKWNTSKPPASKWYLVFQTLVSLRLSLLFILPKSLLSFASV